MRRPCSEPGGCGFDHWEAPDGSITNLPTGTKFTLVWPAGADAPLIRRA